MSIFPSAKMNVLILPGDGIGPEVTEEAVKVMEVTAKAYGVKIALKYADIGGVAIDKHGAPLPEETLALAEENKAVLLGAVGGPKWDKLKGPARPESGLLKIRKSLNLFVNLRPVKIYEALKNASPVRGDIVGNVDLVIVRELTGGIYFGDPRGVEERGGVRYGVNTEVYSEKEIERISRVAFSVAQKRRGKLCSVDKANVLESSVLWREVVDDVHRKSFDGLSLNHMYVDNAAMQLILNPSQFDTILTNNIFGDILSDEASVLSGSLGMLPSASLSYDGGIDYALYEPCHGSAPDIAGKGVANPIGAISSAAMMFKYSFGMEEAHDKILKAVSIALESGYRTSDIGAYIARDGDLKRVSTSGMGDAIADFVSKM